MGIHTAGVRGTREGHPAQPGWAPGGFTEDTLVAESAGFVGRARLGRWESPWPLGEPQGVVPRDTKPPVGVGGEEAAQLVRDIEAMRPWGPPYPDVGMGWS